MRCDIVSCGVGGQGVLSVSAIIAAGALHDGLNVKQSEEHGMSQRGGAVVTHLRLSDEPIHSDIIGQGRANLLISMEPVEALRHLAWLAEDGALFSSTCPVRNIPNYPDLDQILNSVRALPHAVLIDADRLARQAGLAKADNTVMVGAASWRLPLKPETLESCIRKWFASKSEKIVTANIEAFRAGREATTCAAA